MQKRYRPPREYLLFIASFIISVLCRYLSLYEINSRYMHLNEVYCLFAFLPKRIAQEALLTKEPTSHTTVRTDRYTAVQPHKCKDSQQRLRILKYPASASLSFAMKPFNTGLPAIRQYPSLELPHWYYSKILRLSFITHRYNLYRTTRLASGFRHTKKHLSLRYGAFPGDPCGNRTHVNGVRGRCLNRLTNGP